MALSDDEIRRIHEIEQLQEGLTALTAALRAYYGALREVGFNSVEALYLTGVYQNKMVERILSASKAP
jgi:hypothetical protein